MGHPSNKSPDPPDGGFEIATGEDSQESTTLQNAMEPLPDTQPTSQDYQNVSPESHVTCAVPLILRPVQPGADDLSIGFSYDKPSVVKPGQFSGRKQPKRFAPIMGPSVDVGFPRNESHADKTAAFRDADTVEVSPGMPVHPPSPQDKREIQEAPKTQASMDLSLPTERSQTARLIQNNQRLPIVVHTTNTTSLPRKKRPFSDYQPTCRDPRPEESTSMPINPFETTDVDRTVGSLPEHNLTLTKSANMQHNCQRHPVKLSTINSAQQKPRTSFQNDTSVSSAGPPRSMPGSSPRSTVINHPTKDSHRRRSRLSTPATRPRSDESVSRSRHSIVKSNSKAKRTLQTRRVSSSSRSSSPSGVHDAETPSMKQRSKWTPAELLQDRFRQKLVTTAADLAGCFNDKFADIGAEVDKHLQTISDLKKGMSKQRHDLSHYKECISGKDHKIQQLEKHCSQLLAQVDNTQHELDARSSKVSKLEEKCRSYKDFLNNAIKEQQKLYKATKAKCDGAVTKMQAEERKRIALQEQESKKAEEVREKLQQLVQSTVSEYKQKERDFNHQIESLNQKLEERETDIVRERDTAHALLLQNGSITNIQDTLKTFGEKIEEVVNKVNEVAAQQYQQDDQSVKDVHLKLDQIIQFLRVLDGRALPTAELAKEMRELNEETVISISEKLEPIIAAQVGTKNNLDALVSGIEACMHDVWEELDERQTMIEDLYFKQEDGREQRVKALQEEVNGLEVDLAEQDRLYVRSEQELRRREATIDRLQLDMASMALDKEQYLADSQQLERLLKEHAELKDDSDNKASLLSELQNKLQETTEKLVSEEQRHQKHYDELQRRMEQQVAEAEATQALAVEAAQQETMLKMNEMKANNDMQLTQAKDQCTALKKGLDEAKERMTAIEAECSKTADRATDLEKQLQSSRAELAEGIEQFNLKDAEQQTAKEQQSKLVQDLQTKLAHAEVSFKTLCSNTKSYDEAARTILRSMKDWTENYASIKSMFRDMRKDGKKDDILKGIDSKLKPLVELQLLQTAVSQYCETHKEATQLLSGRLTTNKTATRVLSSFESLNTVADSVLDRMRRVIVKSPASNASSPQPPSVQIEQERRRVGEQPKSILKMVPQAFEDDEEDTRGEEEALRELLSNTSLNRGPYNRPVVGRKSQTGLSVTRLSQENPSISSGTDSALRQGAGTAPSTKRKQSFEYDLGSTEARSTKKKMLTSSVPGFSSPPEHAQTRADLGSNPDAPRKARWRGMINDEQPSSPIPSQSSQEQAQSHGTVFRSHGRSGRSTTTRSRPSRHESNDPLSAFYGVNQTTGMARAKKEDSQESLMHSQDLGDDGDISFSSRYFFGS